MVNLEDIKFVGHNLQRPECVLTTSTGELHVADWRGGVTVIAPNGQQNQVLGRGDIELKPNGIAIHPDGGWLIAHLGQVDGGVFRLKPDGTVQPFLLDVGNISLPPTNYVHIDASGRTWITVSTMLQPRARDYRPDAATGFIIMVDKRGARIVAEGLGYTNECAIHPSSGQLYVNETFARRLTRFNIAKDGMLVKPEIVAEFGTGMFPDGLAFDEDGGTWITSIVSNRVVRIDPQGRQEVVVEDTDDNFLSWVEKAFQEGSMNRPQLDTIKSRKLRSTSSLAFGGADRQSVYLGCLLGDSIACFRSRFAGVRPSHWQWN